MYARCPLVQGLSHLDDEELDEVYEPVTELARTHTDENASVQDKLMAKQRAIRAGMSTVQTLRARNLVPQK